MDFLSPGWCGRGPQGRWWCIASCLSCFLSLVLAQPLQSCPANQDISPCVCTVKKNGLDILCEVIYHPFLHIRKRTSLWQPFFQIEILTDCVCHTCRLPLIQVWTLEGSNHQIGGLAGLFPLKQSLIWSILEGRHNFSKSKKKAGIA